MIMCYHKCMNIIDFYKTDYKVEYLSILRQYWKDDKKWSCIGAPKTEHMFLYLDRCSALYTTKEGEIIEAHSGDTIYVPHGSEYSVEFFNFNSEYSSTVNLKFQLFDCKGTQIKSKSKIIRFCSPEVRLFVKELEQLELSRQKVITKYNVNIYNIFNCMGDESVKEKTRSDGFNLINDGIEYLHLHYNENVSVSYLAKICNISEVYFRKLFKKHMGTSPSEYKQELKLEHARRYIEYSDSSVSEIAELTGFTDVSYFIKLFKNHYSITPLAYKKRLAAAYNARLSQPLNTTPQRKTAGLV